MVGFAITRRDRTAVVRNRIRRRLRAVVERHPELLVPGDAYLFGGGVGAEETRWEQLEEWVLKLLERSDP